MMDNTKDNTKGSGKAHNPFPSNWKEIKAAEREKTARKAELARLAELKAAERLKAPSAPNKPNKKPWEKKTSRVDQKAQEGAPAEQRRHNRKEFLSAEEVKQLGTLTIPQYSNDYAELAARAQREIQEFLEQDQKEKWTQKRQQALPVNFGVRVKSGTQEELTPTELPDTEEMHEIREAERLRDASPLDMAAIDQRARVAQRAAEQYQKTADTLNQCDEVRRQRLERELDRKQKLLDAVSGDSPSANALRANLQLELIHLGKDLRALSGLDLIREDVEFPAL